MLLVVRAPARLATGSLARYGTELSDNFAGE